MGLTKHSIQILLLCAVVLTFVLLTTKVIGIGFIPDDGFYYLTLAKHFSQSGSWTFDGVNVTNGFHLLWGYLLAAISFVFRPSIYMFPILSILLTLIILGTSIFYIGYGESITAVLWLGFLSTSYAFIINAVSLTEFCLVIICSYCVITNRQPFIFSMLGVLARTEFIIIPLVVFAVNLFSKQIKVKHLFGGMLGLALVFSHNYIFTGQYISSSALIKFGWADYYPSDVLVDKALYLTQNYLYPKTITNNKIFFAVLVVVPLLAIYFKKIKKEYVSEIIISVLLILVFTAMYAVYAGVQSWYAGVFFVPLFLIGKHLFNRTNKNLAVVIILLGITANVFYRYQAPYPHQEFMKSAGEYLSKNKLDGRVGSWNAGIIGYYQGGKVVNLDGLVNNSIHPYIMSGKVKEYLRKENIKYIVDFRNMYESQFPKQGGYMGLTIEPLIVFDSGLTWWKYLTLGRIK